MTDLEVEEVKDVSEKLSGEGKLYKLSKTLVKEEIDGEIVFGHIVVSGTSVSTFLADRGEGYEVYVFPADESGEVISWRELPGSKKGRHELDQVAEDFAKNAFSSRHDIEVTSE